MYLMLTTNTITGSQKFVKLQGISQDPLVLTIVQAESAKAGCLWLCPVMF